MNDDTKAKSNYQDLPKLTFVWIGNQQPLWDKFTEGKIIWNIFRNYTWINIAKTFWKDGETKSRHRCF